MFYASVTPQTDTQNVVADGWQRYKSLRISGPAQDLRGISTSPLPKRDDCGKSSQNTSNELCSTFCLLASFIIVRLTPYGGGGDVDNNNTVNADGKTDET